MISSIASSRAIKRHALIFRENARKFIQLPKLTKVGPKAPELRPMKDIILHPDMNYSIHKSYFFHNYFQNPTSMLYFI